MEDFIEIVSELLTEDDGGPIGRAAKKTVRIVRGGVESSLGKGVGPLVLTTRAVDYGLGQIGVPVDASPRRQIRAELNDLDKYGGYGVRVLPPDEPPGGDTAGDGARASDTGTAPPPGDVMAGGWRDP